MHDLTASVHHYLTHAPASHFAGSRVEIVQAWEGDDHLLWRATAQGRDVVVKLFMDAGQARSRRQFDGHQIFAPRGLAPDALWADRYPEGLARQLIVYTWSPGTAIDVDDPGAVAGWADAVAQLHAVEIDAVRRFSPHPVNLDFYWRIEATSIAQIQAWLGPGSNLTGFLTQVTVQAERAINAALAAGQGMSPTPVHGDLRAAHTLVERGAILFLDWEMFGLGDPALDAARLLHRERQALGPAHQTLWLERYLAASSTPGLDARIELYRRLLVLHDVVFLLVGLEQQAATGATADLAAALPFLQATLTQALDAAASVFAVPLPATTAADVTAIFEKFHAPRA